VGREMVRKFGELIGGKLGEELLEMTDTADHSFCPFCKNPVTIDSFENDTQKKEFEITGLCPACQKKVFGQ